MIIAVAIVNREGQPMYFNAIDADPSEFLNLQQLAFCSLDAIEQKVPAPGQDLDGWKESYLGVVYSMMDARVAGYMTNTRHTILCVLDDTPMREDHLRLAFKQLHVALVDALCNPFSSAPESLESSRLFDAKVKSILQPS